MHLIVFNQYWLSHSSNVRIPLMLLRPGRVQSTNPKTPRAYSPGFTILSPLLTQPKHSQQRVSECFWTYLLLMLVQYWSVYCCVYWPFWWCYYLLYVWLLVDTAMTGIIGILVKAGWFGTRCDPEPERRLQHLNEEHLKASRTLWIIFIFPRGNCKKTL